MAHSNTEKRKEGDREIKRGKGEVDERESSLRSQTKGGKGAKSWKPPTWTGATMYMDGMLIV